MTKLVWPLMCALAMICAVNAGAQTQNKDEDKDRDRGKDKDYVEVYALFGRRSSRPGTTVAGGGGDIFVYKGLAVGGDVVTTVGNPDNKMTISSIGSSYHFFCCHATQRVEPFAGVGFSSLHGDINTHGYTYPVDPGQDRSGPNYNQGLVLWPTKHVGVRFEVKEYRMFVSYGALENVIPGKFVEFHFGVALR
jgi:hypothetical protein